MDTNKEITNTKIMGGEWLILILCLSLFAWQTATASQLKSASFDEQYHLAAGAAYLKTADFRMTTTHPPLAGLFAATALQNHDDLIIPTDHPSWNERNIFTFAEQFMWITNDNAQSLLVAARIPIIFLGIVLLLVIWIWARQIWGVWASWIALLLAVFDPNLLANSRLITSDLALTLFFLLAMWRFWHWLKRPSWVNLLLVGLFAGCAIATKYTGLLIAPTLLLCWGIFPHKKPNWSHQFFNLVGMGFVALFVLWAVYRFDTGVIAGSRLPIPVPAPYFWQNLWATFVKLPSEATAKLNFLLGQVSLGGWWYYFPVALAVKTPLPTLLLSLFGIIMVGRNGRIRETICIGLPPLVFLALGMTGLLTIGYRHILPALPFFILFAGYGGQELITRSFRKRPYPAILLSILFLWLILRTGRIYPHQEAYFNELAGDWSNWSTILVDSNLDWGQDLIALRQLMHDYGLGELNLAYFGMAHPEAYDINYKPLPGYLKFVAGNEVSAYNPYTPQPGWYAISATSLRLGTLSPETAAYYKIFQEMTPVGRAGYSIYLYHIPEERYEGTNHIQVTEKPVGQHSATDLGITPPQRTIAHWRKSTSSSIIPAEQIPTADYTNVQVNFDDVMILLGYVLTDTAVSNETPLELTLYWQMGKNPMHTPSPATAPPLSTFVHLTGAEPWQVVAQHDGWETALRSLQAGDIISQTITLPINHETPVGEYNLLTGLYSPQSGERLLPDTAVNNETFIHLTTIQIEDANP